MTDGIVLLAKQPGLTSFSSLYDVKKALGTNKVGHTGTLDSFAQGLLVVCTGRLTKLAGNITEFDKDYRAVIAFGKETDTLEYTGNVIRETELPTEKALSDAVKNHTGKLMQIPPVFSAIHVDGKRASDLARKGQTAELPSRPITVYKADLIEIKKDDRGLVTHCMIDFSVSKGTYIRSLARDIAAECGSSGHLLGLYRTRIGNFSIDDAAGKQFIKDFTINGCIKESAEVQLNCRNEMKQITVQKEILEKMKQFDEETAKLCGFVPVHINSRFEQDFRNGKPVLKSWFAECMSSMSVSACAAVFTGSSVFCGLIEKKDSKRFNYRFVIN